MSELREQIEDLLFAIEFNLTCETYAQSERAKLEKITDEKELSVLRTKLHKSANAFRLLHKKATTSQLELFKTAISPESLQEELVKK